MTSARLSYLPTMGPRFTIGPIFAFGKATSNFIDRRNMNRGKRFEAGSNSKTAKDFLLSNIEPPHYTVRIKSEALTGGSSPPRRCRLIESDAVNRRRARYAVYERSLDLITELDLSLFEQAFFKVKVENNKLNLCFSM